MTAAIETLPRVALVTLSDALDIGEQAWDGLLARAGSSSPFMTWAWHRAWTQAVSRTERDACHAIVLKSSSGEVDAVFPLRVQPARFHRAPVIAAEWGVSDLGCPDHLELLATPDADLEALVDALEAVPWQVMRLENVAEGAANIQRFREACESRGWTVRSRALWRCPYLELPDDWEHLVATMGRSSRRNVRRYERQLERKYEVALTDYTTRWEEGWRHLRRLHDRRWAGGGSLHDPRLEEMHRWFGAWLAERGLLSLVTLDLDGTPVAAWYGFSYGDTHCAYQSGWDPDFDSENVGTVLMTRMMQRAIERGERKFDFLRGEEFYKSIWAGATRSCYEIVVMRAGLRGALLRGLDWVARRRAPVWTSNEVKAGT